MLSVPRARIAGGAASYGGRSRRSSGRHCPLFRARSFCSDNPCDFTELSAGAGGSLAPTVADGPGHRGGPNGVDRLFGDRGFRRNRRRRSFFVGAAAPGLQVQSANQNTLAAWYRARRRCFPSGRSNAAGTRQGAGQLGKPRHAATWRPIRRPTPPPPRRRSRYRSRSRSLNRDRYRSSKASLDHCFSRWLRRDWWSSSSS